LFAGCPICLLRSLLDIAVGLFVIHNRPPSSLSLKNAADRGTFRAERL
jgi:hypothetical protein